MEERIKELIKEHEERVFRLKEKEDILLSKVDFYKLHNFKEEERIALLKWDIISTVLYPYSELLKDLKNMQNDWNS